MSLFLRVAYRIRPGSPSEEVGVTSKRVLYGRHSFGFGSVESQLKSISESLNAVDGQAMQNFHVGQLARYGKQIFCRPSWFDYSNGWLIIADWSKRLIATRKSRS